MSFEKRIKINVDLNSLESIRKALEEYRNLLIQNKVFDDLTFSQCFSLEFLALDGEQFSYEDIEKLDNEKIVKYFKEYFQYAESYEYISEELLFAYALNYEELKYDIFETIKEIVNYARKVNNTDDMWVDDYNVFGLGAVYITANMYPEYSYMLGAYMIPYWDDEHAPYAIELVQDFCIRKGICRETLKIYCYCDGYLRYNLFGERYRWDYEKEMNVKRPEFVEPVEWFRENKEEYEWFKNTLKERFREFDYLQYSQSDYEPHPIDSFYKDLVDRNENYDGFSEFFVYDNADIEAEQLEKEIIEYIGHPLVEDQEEDDEDDYYYYGDGIKEWKEFVKSYAGMPVWDYIENGGDIEVLDEVEGTNPDDLRKLIIDSAYILKKKILFHTGPFTPINEELSHIVMDIFYDWYNEDEEIDIDQIETSSTKNAKLIRFLDFLYHLFNYEEFDPSFVSFITEEYELLSEEEFYTRYSKSAEGRLNSIIKDYLSLNICPYGDELNRLYRNFNKLRETEWEKAVELIHYYIDYSYLYDIFPDSRRIINSKWILFMTYFISQDIELGKKDKVTEFISSYLNDNFIKIIVEEIKEHIKENGFEDKIEEFENKFLKEEKVPQLSKEIMMKVMKEGPGALNEEEMKEFEAFRNANKAMGSKSADTNFTELLDTILLKTENKWKKGNFYNVLSETNMRLYLQSIYLLVEACYKVVKPAVNVEFLSKARMILASFIELAPIITINKISKLWMSHNTFEFTDELLGKVEFMDSFKRLKIVPVYTFAWDIYHSFHNNDLDRIVDILGDIDEEAESSFFGQTEKRRRENYYKAIEYIDQEERLKIFKEVEEKYNIKTLFESEMAEIMEAYLDKLIFSQFSILTKDNEYENCIYNDSFENYKGENFGIESTLSSPEVKNIFMTRNYNDNFGLIVCREENGYKAYGDVYLVDLLNNKAYYEHHWFSNIKLIVTEDLGVFNDREEIKNMIMSYLKGQLPFEALNAYFSYINDFVNDIDGTYTIDEFISNMTDSVRYRFLKLLLKIGFYRTEEYMSWTIGENTDRLEKYLEIFKELEKNTDNFVLEILENNDSVEILYLWEKMDIIEIIKKQNDETRLNLLERFAEDDKLNMILSHFEDDKSRLIRDLVKEYNS